MTMLLGYATFGAAAEGGGLEQLRRSKQCFKGKREVEKVEDEAQKGSKRCLGSYL